MCNQVYKTDERARASIEEIASDTASGAAEILGRAAEVFSLLYDSPVESLDLERARAIVAETCAGLVRAQPLMTPLANLASTVLTAAMNSTDADEVMRLAADRARKFIERAARAATMAASHAAALIHDGATVMTHSRSSTVVAALIKAVGDQKTISVIATESRPILEGRIVAARLVREGANVRLIADAAAALMMKEADLIFVGADTVTPHAVINKIGTHMIAMEARWRGLPVYALCDGSKLTARASGLIERQHSAEELWPEPPEGISVVNYYFEPTPLAYFTGIITEDGALRPEEAASRASEITLHEALLDAIE